MGNPSRKKGDTSSRGVAFVLLSGGSFYVRSTNFLSSTFRSRKSLIFSTLTVVMISPKAFTLRLKPLRSACTFGAFSWYFFLSILHWFCESRRKIFYGKNTEILRLIPLVKSGQKHRGLHGGAPKFPTCRAGLSF